MLMMRLECLSLPDKNPVPISEATILCLGNFDGVHLGHRARLKKAVELKAELPHAACGVFCFRTPPAELLLGAKAPSRLSTTEQKLDAFCEAGMEFVILADFAEMKDLSPLAFVQTVLMEQCHCAAAVCGFNYHFGVGGSGTAELLRNTLPHPVVIVDAVNLVGDIVSSSRIRSLLKNGDVETAALLLGHPYTLQAPVIHGKGLGHHLGAPTINQRFSERTQLPRYGVYVTQCEIGGMRYRGVTNVGVHPTVDKDALVNCETYLLDFDGSLYGEDVSVSFLHFLRPEQKFESREALSAQIQADIEAARAF